MSIIGARVFMDHCRGRLRDRVAMLGDDPDIAQLAQLGWSQGFQFEVEDLRQAFAYDWMLRRLAAAAAEAESLASKVAANAP